MKPEDDEENPAHALSGVHLANKTWPYLLRDRKIERSNEVFALDTTDVQMAQGFVYLTAVIDLASRRVLAHRLLHEPPWIFAHLLLIGLLASY